MPNAIDNAIARIQDIVAALSTVPPTGTTIRAEADYPVEAAQGFPFSIAYLATGTFHATNATMHHNFPVIKLEIHFSRSNLRQTYQQINAIAWELPKRLVGDPQLNGAVVTVVATKDTPIQYVARPFEYAGIKSHVMEMNIPVKLLESPQTTA